MTDDERTRIALEELRTADRILMSIEGSLGYLRNQQVLDCVGLSSNESMFGEAEREDTAHANEELINAQGSLRRAMDLLGLQKDSEIETLDKWHLSEWMFDNPVFDFISSKRAQGNLNKAKVVRAKVRELFSKVRNADPALANAVAPLYEDEPESGMDKADAAIGQLVGVNPRFWTPLHWAGAVIAAIFALLVFVSWIIAFVS